jgi:branched-chain amino acid transport system permease protein
MSGRLVHAARYGAKSVIQDHLFFTGINVLLAWSAYLMLSCGSLSLANGAFMAIGAYSAGFLTVSWGLPLSLAIFLAGILTAAIGLLMAFPALRTKGIYFVMLTVGITFIVQAAFENTEIVGGVRGMGGLLGTEVWHVFVLVFVVLLGLIWVSRSHLQRLLDAAREDEQVAQAIGINVVYLKVLSFAIGAMIAGCAGALYAHYMVFISPEHFGISLSLYICLSVVLGGTNNLWGPALGATVITLLPEVSRGLADWRALGFGVAIVLLLLVRPDGILSFRVRTILGTKKPGSIQNTNLERSMRLEDERYESR